MFICKITGKIHELCIHEENTYLQNGRTFWPDSLQTAILSQCRQLSEISTQTDEESTDKHAVTRTAVRSVPVIAKIKGRLQS